MSDFSSTRHPLAAIQQDLEITLPNDLPGALKLMRPIVARHNCALTFDVGTLSGDGRADLMVCCTLVSGDEPERSWQSCVPRGAVEEESRLLALMYLFGIAVADPHAVAPEAATAPPAAPLPEADAQAQVDRMLAKLRAVRNEPGLRLWEATNTPAALTIKQSSQEAYQRLVLGFRGEKHRILGDTA